MEVHFAHDVEKKLNDLARRANAEAPTRLCSAWEGDTSTNLSRRELLDSRYDDLKSGSVKPIEGKESFESLPPPRRRIARQAMTAECGFTLHPLAAQDITQIWEYIAEDNPLLTRRFREEILSRIRTVVSIPPTGHRRPDVPVQLEMEKAFSQ